MSGIRKTVWKMIPCLSLLGAGGETALFAAESAPSPISSGCQDNQRLQELARKTLDLAKQADGSYKEHTEKLGWFTIERYFSEQALLTEKCWSAPDEALRFLDRAAASDAQAVKFIKAKWSLRNAIKAREEAQRDNRAALNLARSGANVGRITRSVLVGGTQEAPHAGANAPRPPTSAANPPPSYQPPAFGPLPPPPHTEGGPSAARRRQLAVERRQRQNRLEQERLQDYLKATAALAKARAAQSQLVRDWPKYTVISDERRENLAFNANALVAQKQADVDAALRRLPATLTNAPNRPASTVLMTHPGSQARTIVIRPTQPQRIPRSSYYQSTKANVQYYVQRGVQKTVSWLREGPGWLQWLNKKNGRR